MENKVEKVNSFEIP